MVKDSRKLLRIVIFINIKTEARIFIGLEKQNNCSPLEQRLFTKLKT